MCSARSLLQPLPHIQIVRINPLRPVLRRFLRDRGVTVRRLWLRRLRWSTRLDIPRCFGRTRINSKLPHPTRGGLRIQRRTHPLGHAASGRTRPRSVVQHNPHELLAGHPSCLGAKRPDRRRKNPFVAAHNCHGPRAAGPLFLYYQPSDRRVSVLSRPSKDHPNRGIRMGIRLIKPCSASRSVAHEDRPGLKSTGQYEPNQRRKIQSCEPRINPGSRMEDVVCVNDEHQRGYPGAMPTRVCSGHCNFNLGEEALAAQHLIPALNPPLLASPSGGGFWLSPGWISPPVLLLALESRFRACPSGSSPAAASPPTR